MQKNPLRVYVGHALQTKVPPEFERLIWELRSLLTAAGYEVLEYLGKNVGTAQDVYRHDIGMVTNSQLMVAVLDYPSTGLGMEIMHALNCSIPVLGLAREGAKVSRLAMGTTSQFFRFERYTNAEDMLGHIDQMRTRYYAPLQPALL